MIGYPFDGCWERIRRAKAHREAFGDEWERFLDDDPYTTSVHVDDDGEGSIHCWPVTDVLPAVLSMELGEMLYQLRAALDSAAYDAAILDSGQDPPPDAEHLEFPVCSSAAKFAKSAWHIRPLADERQRIIETVQPYNAPNLPKPMRYVPETLAMIHDWARKDRHRKLHVIGSWASDMQPEVQFPEGTSLLWISIRGTGFLEKDSEVARFKIVGWEPGTGMYVEANPDLFIEVGVDESPPRRDAKDTLGWRCELMHEAVAGLIRTFERSFGLR